MDNMSKPNRRAVLAAAAAGAFGFAAWTPKPMETIARRYRSYSNTAFQFDD
jgi:hypothetical protein